MERQIEEDLKFSRYLATAVKLKSDAGNKVNNEVFPFVLFQRKMIE